MTIAARPAATSGVLRCVRSSERVWRLSLAVFLAGRLSLDFAPWTGDVLKERREQAVAVLLTVLATTHLDALELPRAACIAAWPTRLAK